MQRVYYIYIYITYLILNSRLLMKMEIHRQIDSGSRTTIEAIVKIEFRAIYFLSEQQS